MHISGIRLMTLASAGGAGFSMTPTKLYERLGNSIILRKPLYRTEAHLLAANIHNLDPLHAQQFQFFANSLPSRSDQSGPADPAAVLPPTLQGHLVSDGFLRRATVAERSSDLRDFIMLLNMLDDPQFRHQIVQSSKSVFRGRYSIRATEPETVELPPDKPRTPDSPAVRVPAVLTRISLSKPSPKTGD